MEAFLDETGLGEASGCRLTVTAKVGTTLLAALFDLHHGQGSRVLCMVRLSVGHRLCAFGS